MKRGPRGSVVVVGRSNHAVRTRSRAACCRCLRRGGGPRLGRWMRAKRERPRRSGCGERCRRRGGDSHYSGITTPRQTFSPRLISDDRAGPGRRSAVMSGRCRASWCISTSRSREDPPGRPESPRPAKPRPRRSRRRGYICLHIAIDDYSRSALRRGPRRRDCRSCSDGLPVTASRCR